MPRPYTQLLLVNMLLAVLISCTVLGGPVFPALVGAIGGGAVLYARRRKRERPTFSTKPAEHVTPAAPFPTEPRPQPDVGR